MADNAEMLHTPNYVQYISVSTDDDAEEDWARLK